LLVADGFFTCIVHGEMEGRSPQFFQDRAHREG
jgi:hypothetical protein